MALNDVSKHGSLEDALDVADLEAKEDEERWCDEAVGTINATRRKPKRAAAPLVDPARGDRDFVVWHQNSVFMDDWPTAYEACLQWQDMWKSCHEPGAEWPHGCQLRADKKQFMYIDGKLCVPTSLAKRLVNQWHEGPLGHAGQRKMIADMKTRFVMAD